MKQLVQERMWFVYGVKRENGGPDRPDLLVGDKEQMLFGTTKEPVRVLDDLPSSTWYWARWQTGNAFIRYMIERGSIPRRGQVRRFFLPIFSITHTHIA